MINITNERELNDPEPLSFGRDLTEAAHYAIINPESDDRSKFLDVVHDDAADILARLYELCEGVSDQEAGVIAKKISLELHASVKEGLE